VVKLLLLVLVVSPSVHAQRVCVGGTRAGLGCTVDANCTGGGVCAGHTPPPDRNGAAAGLGDNTSCPPGPDATTKGAPAATLGDKDVNNDGRDDFFMGEWKFVEGAKDLIVRQWCINKPAVGGHFADFLTFQIITSLNGVETERVPPKEPT